MTDRTSDGHQDNVLLNEALADPTLERVRQDAAPEIIIFDFDHAADALYLIESGQVRVYQVGSGGSSRLAGILGAGDWCGLSALSDQTTYKSRAVAVTRTTLSRIPTAPLLARLRAMGALESGLLFYLAAALQRAQEETARLVFDDCRARLVKALVHFSDSSAASPGDGGVVLRITHEQLAQSVGAARETVSLALTQLRRQKLLRTGRNRLFFDPAALRAFAGNRSAATAPVEASTDHAPK